VSSAVHPSRNRYAMLVCSLPSLPPTLFAERQTPISRLQLDRRLALLTPADAARLSTLEAVLQWDRLPLDLSDRQAVSDFRAVLAALPPGLPRATAQWRLEDRTLLAALRRRHLGRPAPEKGEDWGCGRWVERIRNAWHEPVFGLERLFPWAGEAARLLAAGDSPGLERLLLGHTWAGLGRLGANHHFDFEAVLIYVLKWDIIRRWSSYNGVAALRRFMDLSDAGMEGREALFTE
jgi:hypothetical protein